MNYSTAMHKFASKYNKTAASPWDGVRNAWGAIRSLPSNLASDAMTAQRAVAHHADRALSQNVAQAAETAAAQQAVARAHPSVIPGTGVPTPATMPGPLPSAARSVAQTAGSNTARSRLGFGSGLALGAGTLGLGALGYAATRPPPPYNNTGGMSY